MVSIVAISSKPKFRTQLEKTLTDISFSYCETQARGDAIQLSSLAVEKGANIIVAIGGDGTVNEVINGIMQKRREACSEVLLAILPLGTGNDFARHIGIKKDIAQLQHSIVSNNSRKIDLMEATFISPEGVETSRFFFNITDIGIGGCAAQIIDKNRRLMPGIIRYELAAFFAFFKYKATSIDLCMDGQDFHSTAISICFANAPYFANGLCIAPHAQVDDGKIAITILGKLSFMDYLKYYSVLKKGDKIDHPEVIYKKANMCAVSTVGMPIDMDGEFVGYTPMRLKIIPKAMNLLHTGI